MSEPEEDELLEISKVFLRENTSKNTIDDEELVRLVKNIVLLYKEVSGTFTTQPHYRWDTSHLQTMCENIKWYSPTTLTDVHMALNAEANMIFRDRLVSDEEKSQYRALAGKYLPYDGDVFFTPRLRDGVYLEPVDYEQWSRTANRLINQCLTDDENAFGETGIEACRELAVLFPAVATAMRGGVLVCVGSAGADASAAARLVCAALGATYHDVPATPIAQGQLANTIRNALSAASEGTRACVVVYAEGTTDDEDEDSEREDRGGAEACLARVEALLRARVASALPAALARAAPALQGVTLHDVKQNLGIVVCIDQEWSELRALWAHYPWMCSALQWTGRWADDTLRRLPALIIHRLMKNNAQEVNKDDMDSIPVEGFVGIYRGVRATQRAPCRYVALVRAYYHVITRKRDALLDRRNMLSAGVEALRRARVEVATLQEEAAVQEAALSQEQSKASAALEQIGATVRTNTDKREEMNQLKRSIEVENEQLQTRKKEIEEELAGVEPIIAAARAAVGDIRPEALSEVRSLRAPPDAVRDVLEGVLRLMGVADTSWHSMKSFLSKRGIKEDIRHLDASNVSAEAAAAVARLVARRPGSFEEATARRASAACAPLAAWVRAQLSHANALAHVRPLRDKQYQLQRKVSELEAQLAALEGGLATVEERVAALTAQLGEHTRAAAALELRVAAVGSAIRRASLLLEQLAREYTDWEAHLEETTKELSELTLLSLLAAAYIVYLPEMTEPQAREVLAKWASQMGHKDLNFSPINFLSTPDKQFKWVADGLPSDQSTMKNAVVIEQYLGEQQCGFSPLIIDPDGEAEAWLRSTLAGTAADFVPQHSDKLKTAIQYATRHGRVLVITEVEECGWWCDAARASGVRTLLLARSPLRHAPLPRRAAQRSVLYMAPRLHALVDQLVQYTIQKQNPDMIERYKEIKLQKAALQKEQHELQENLLKELSNNRDILHDEALSESLQKTREAGARIASALSAAEALEAAVSRASAASAPAATRAALLALAVRQLQPHHNTLTLPLDAVQQAFLDAVSRRQDVNDVNTEEVVGYFMRTMFDRLLLSLHKRDKYIVLMHLLRQVYDDLMPEKLWKIFINHIGVVEDASTVDEIKQQHGWVAQEHLKKLAQIKMQDSDLFNRMSMDSEDMWLAFQSSGDLNSIRHLKLSPFEHVVAVSVLRPQSTYRAVVVFVDRILGATRGGASLERAVRYAERTRPALLLGAHAMLQLTSHADAHGRTLVTVGIEGGATAWEAGLGTVRHGGWLAVNVGAAPFTRDLQAFITRLSQRPEELSEDFRLWIVTEDRDVPPATASSCLSVVLEAPEGVKHNVCSTLRTWASVRAPPALLRHLTCLALFHAVVQERRAYIPQGWSQWYSWEWGDVSAAKRVLESAGACAGARELCGVLYAARAGEARDRRVLRALRRLILDVAPQRVWTPPAMEHALPLANDITTYLDAFNTLPDIDPPELLGLPANYRLAWEKNAADNMIAGLRDYDTTSISKKPDNITPTRTILGMWKKHMSGSPLLKGDFDIETACGGRGWWRDACAGEARDVACAARALHRALTHFARAPLRADVNLYKVPDEWQVLWSGPESPELYIKEFCFRARAAVERLQECKRDGGEIPKEVDVRTFLRPTRLLSALRASAAERTRRAPHSLSLVVDWGVRTAEEGVSVVGLRLSGGVWAGHELRPADARAPPDAPAPPLCLRYVPTDAGGLDIEDGDAAGREGEGFYAVVYESAARAAPLWRARAPLAPHLRSDHAELHALALYVAPV